MYIPGFTVGVPTAINRYYSDKLWSGPAQLAVHVSPIISYNKQTETPFASPCTCQLLPSLYPHHYTHTTPTPPHPHAPTHALSFYPVLTGDMAVQDRQRQGIPGIHMRSLDEHLDQQELQKLLGEVIHHTRASMDHPAPDHQVLAKVTISRQVLFDVAAVIIK